MRILLLLLISVNVFAQVKRPDTVFCDCASAKVINVNSKTIYGKTIAPNGSGDKKEISPVKQKTKFAFEKEHNTAWYKLVVNSNGSLTFDITTSKTDDDYDFMLFKAGKKFCDSLQNYHISPIRACISRDKEELKGKTGLNFKAKQEFTKYGIGPAYCAAVAVKKGDVFYLVLDNVYDRGDGHTIEFLISQIATINGKVTDENNKPVAAEVTLTNQKGDVILHDTTDRDGSYNFKVPLVKNIIYSLNFYNDSSFTFTKTFTVADTTKLKSIVSVLPKLKKGNKFSIGSINFVPGSAQYLPQALPAMNNLARLIKKNKHLKIKIIGHSNGRDMLTEDGIIKFTQERAITIKNYLISQDIEETRIETDGKGDHEMLFKLPKATEEEQIQNRRVEVMVLEY